MARQNSEHLDEYAQNDDNMMRVIWRSLFADVQRGINTYFVLAFKYIVI